MFHDKRRCRVRREETPKDVFACEFQQKWPQCTTIEIGCYMFLNDALHDDTSTDYAGVNKRPTRPGGQFLQIAPLLKAFSYDNALVHARRTLAGDYDALATNLRGGPATRNG